MENRREWKRENDNSLTDKCQVYSAYAASWNPKGVLRY